MKFIRSNRSRAGVSLVMVTFAVSLLATLSVSMVMVTNSSTKQKQSERQQVGALFAAEAGIAEAVFALNNGQSGNVGSAGQPVVQNGSTYYVQETVLGNGMRSLVSTGTDNNSGMRVELTVQQTNSSIWTRGAFGDESLSMDSNARTDSYDSTQGTYNSQKVNGNGSNAYGNPNGDVGSNGDITLDSNAKVWGNATCGTTSTTTLNGNSTVSGSTAPATGAVTLPALQVPSFPSQGDWYASGGSNTLASGDWEFDHFELDSNAKLTVMGPATIVFDSFEVKSNAELWIDPTGGPVEFFIRGDFQLDSNSILSPTTYDPSQLAVNLESDNIANPNQNVQLSQVSFQSNSVLYGTLFAPNARVEINSNFELYGAVVARQVHLDSNSRVHYDESLGNGNASNKAQWEAVCWRKMSFKAPQGANYP